MRASRPKRRAKARGSARTCVANFIRCGGPRMRETVVPRRWPDATVICVCPGPTLTLTDVEAVHGRAPVIAVGSSVRWVEWADVLYSSDRRWWSEYRGYPTFRGARYGVGLRVGARSAVMGTEPFVVEVLKHTGDSGLEPDPSGLRTGRNSGYAAINLAVHLGAKRIVLLGYTMGPVEGRDHFFGKHPPTLPTSTPALYDTFRRLYVSLLAPLAERDITVLNATPNSYLTVFPRTSIQSALAEVA